MVEQGQDPLGEQGCPSGLRRGRIHETGLLDLGPRNREPVEGVGCTEDVGENDGAGLVGGRGTMPSQRQQPLRVELQPQLLTQLADSALLRGFPRFGFPVVG